MKGFTIVDPSNFPSNSDDLQTYGLEGIALLGNFYGQATLNKSGLVIPPLVNVETLKSDYEVYKLFVLKSKLEFENEQQMKLSQAEVNLKNNEKTLKTMASLLSDRRRLTIKNNIKKLEKEIESLKKIFVILLRSPQKIGLSHLCPSDIKTFQSF